MIKNYCAVYNQNVDHCHQRRWKFIGTLHKSGGCLENREGYSVHNVAMQAELRFFWENHSRVHGIWRLSLIIVRLAVIEPWNIYQTWVHPIKNRECSDQYKHWSLVILALSLHHIGALAHQAHIFLSAPRKKIWDTIYDPEVRRPPTHSWEKYIVHCHLISWLRFSHWDWNIDPIIFEDVVECPLLVSTSGSQSCHLPPKVDTMGWPHVRAEAQAQWLE
jgi:hypothetical protein